MVTDCTRAEVLAGAVALGEATDVERDAYRRHLAGCQRCIETLGGERDIERVMTVVADARDAERWDPDIRSVLAERKRGTRRAWRYGFSVAALAIAASLGVHAMIAAGVSPTSIASNAQETLDNANVQHVTLEHRAAGSITKPASQPAHPVVAAAPKLVVLHNVVNLDRPKPATHAAVPAAAAAAAPRSIAPATSAETVAVAPTNHDRSSIAALKTSGGGAQQGMQAESIYVMPNASIIHEAVPIGGENAIVPHPSTIAYDEGAEGTTAFEVTIDERGTPTKCTITKASGYLVLDEAVCKAAMGARYLPKMINGRPVTGIYRDAFTFRSNE